MGFEMELTVVRAHLASALAPIRRVKRKVSTHGIVVSGERFADDLQRNKAARTQWGATPWAEETYERMQCIGEQIFAGFVDQSAELAGDAIVATKTLLKVTPEVERAAELFGTSWEDEMRWAFPTFANALQLLDEVLDDDLVPCRELCGEFELIQKQHDRTQSPASARRVLSR